MDKSTDFCSFIEKKNNAINSLLVTFSNNQDLLELKNLLNNAVETTDFYTIFHVDEFEISLPDEVTANLNEFNLYLANCDFSEVGTEFTSKILENIIETSKRELMGLYTTPPGLAKYLVDITLENAEGHFADFTVGSGTIAKFLMEKISEYRGTEYAHEHIWISDKYSYPLQIANLAITSKESMNYKNIVFQSDAIDIDTGKKINIVNPSTGDNEELVIPKFNCIISNLPFISSNNQQKIGTDKIEILKKYDLDNRVDLYQLLILKYKDLLSDNPNAKIGVITSNSWFKTQKEYKAFYKIINEIFDVEFVITSNKGKWFDNADVVASIIILKNKSTQNSHKVKFVGLNKNPRTCSSEELEDLVSQTIFCKNSSELSVQEYSNQDIIRLIDYGLSLEPLFDDLSWFEEIKEKIICLNKVFNSSRGVRTGADKLFITNSIKVDSNYSYPLLKNLNKVDNYRIAEVEDYYFYTKESIEKLEELDKKKTLSYLQSIEGSPAAMNRKAKLGNNWYQADQIPQYADFTTSINPEKRFFWAKFSTPTVVNQRVTAFRLKEEYLSDSILIHALLNSSLSLFLLIGSGFGRGLGVTDLTKDGISQSYFLNPNILETDNKEKIVSAWLKVSNRKIEDIYSQLDDKEWIEFNKIVLRSYGLEDKLYDCIKQSILNLLNRRLSVKNS